MNAEDVKPNRLEKAKGEIIGFIDKLEGDRIGLVAFAGKAFIQCPLTLDYGAVRIFLDSVNTKIIPVPGTAIGEAIRCAIGAFNQKERKYKALILLTDGEDHGTQPIKAAEEAKKHGIRIYTIGIGSPEGEPIPIRGATGAIIGYKRDAKGNIVMSKLDEITLEKIALITNGKYYRATPGEIELDKIYKEICKMEKKELFTRKFTQYEDRFQIFLVIALFVLCLECVISDRKRIKKVWRGRFV
jgi:Ca-activated chloride channel family protein